MSPIFNFFIFQEAVEEKKENKDEETKESEEKK